jgi:predicted esterase
VIARTIPAHIHGRYLIVPPPGGGAAPVLVGFHGYAEAAEHQLERLRAIGPPREWLLVSIQGLNRFYQRRTNDVIAGWMTRQDREAAIADNLRYVDSVVDEVFRDWACEPTIVFAGFSQGVAMAFRAAARSARAVAGVIAAGGDVPPEIEPEALARVRAALVCHGARDEWYTPQKFDDDLSRLRRAGVAVRALDFAGGHEWSDDVNRAAATFLSEDIR